MSTELTVIGVMIKVIDDMIQDGAFMTGEITDLK